jgi:hypothetical protein
LTAAAGTQAGAEVLPDNPLAPVVGGLIAGGVPTVARSIQYRAPAAQLASNAIHNMMMEGGMSKDDVANQLQPSSLNSTEIVPGSTPTLAQITKNPDIARVERQFQGTTAANNKESANNAARQKHFETASGTPQDIEAFKTQRKDTSEPLYEKAAEQPLDPEAIKPVLDKFDAAIEKVGEGSDAGQTLLTIKKKIMGALPTKETQTIGADGKPVITKAKNPTQSPLIQIYREERDKLAKKAGQEGAYADAVKTAIQPVHRELGKAIESQSPDFAKAQQTYRDISPKIKTAEWLQGLKLTDNTGRYTLNKVQNALQNTKKLMASSGRNAAQNVTPEQLEVLQNLHDDLLRREEAARAGDTRGSNTVQNALTHVDMQSNLGKANELAGGNAPELAGSLIGGGIGSAVGAPYMGAAVGDMAARYIKGSSAKRMESAKNLLRDFTINPENYKQYLIDSQNNHFLNRFSNNLLKNP